MPQELGALEAIAVRRSIRRYSPEPVPAADLQAILKAGLAAPSSGNQRAWRFLVVEREEDRRRLLEESAKALVASLCEERLARNGGAEALLKATLEAAEGYATAPVIVAVLGDAKGPWPGYLKHDCPIAAATMMIAARSLGYGSVYLSDTVTEAGLRAAFGLSGRWVSPCSIALGLPAEEPEAREPADPATYVWRGAPRED